MENVALQLLVDDIVASDPPSAEMAEPMFKALRVLSAPTLDESDQQRHEQRED